MKKNNKLAISTGVLGVCIILLALSIKVIHTNIHQLNNDVKAVYYETMETRTSDTLGLTPEQLELFQSLYESNAITKDNEYNFICEKLSVKEYVNIGALPAEAEDQYVAWRVANHPVEIKAQDSFRSEIAENLPVFEYIYASHQRIKADNEPEDEMSIWCEQLEADQYVVMEQLPENGSELYREWRLQAHPLVGKEA